MMAVPYGHSLMGKNLLTYRRAVTTVRLTFVKHMVAHICSADSPSMPETTNFYGWGVEVALGWSVGGASANVGKTRRKASCG
jgi:hypothetical protein